MPAPTTITTLPPLRTSTTSTKQKRHSDGTRSSTTKSPKYGEVKPVKGRKKALESDHDSGDEGNMSFLQFCPTCEEQILVPNNSVLYCSEDCRRADCGTSPPQSPLRSPQSTASHPKIIVAPLSPTQVKQPISFARPATQPQPSPASSVERHNTRLGHHERTTSEAANYLAQFQSDKARSMRPRSGRHATSLTSTGNIAIVPSLSTTPTSTPNSSLSFTPSTSRENIHSTGYHPTSASNARSMASKSIDLVLPTAAAAMKPSEPSALPPHPPPSIETITPKTAAMSLSKDAKISAAAGIKEVRNSLDDDYSGSQTSKIHYEKRKYRGGDGGGSGSSAKSSLKTLLSNPSAGGGGGGNKVRGSEREREREKFAAAA